MSLAKLADRAEIRVAQPRHRHKVDALVAGPINPPRRVDPLAVGIKQKCRHHPRMVGRITPLLVVLRENRPQIQSLANRLPDQVCNVPRRHKVLHRGRKQPHLIHVPRAKNLAHTLQRIELLAPCPLRFLLLPGQAPRRPASGSGLSLTIPAWHAALYDPGEFDHRYGPVLRCRHGLRRVLSGSALPKFPQSASRGARLSGLPDSLTLRPARLLAPL